MTDPFSGNVDKIDQPAESIADITPSDDTEFDPPSRALWVGGAGNVSVTTVNGHEAVIQGVQAGTLLPIRVTKVKAATTATLIQRWW